MTRVVQSAGRLIRSENDSGVIVLACRRFLKEPYRSYLPPDWYGDDPSELASSDVAGDAAAFFARVQGEAPRTGRG
jgi:Rad3-related DNA helicase